MHKNKKRERGRRRIPTTHRVIPLVVRLSAATLDRTGGRKGERPEEKFMVVALLLRLLLCCVGFLCDVRDVNCECTLHAPIDWVSLLWSLVFERTLYLILLLIPM